MGLVDADADYIFIVTWLQTILHQMLPTRIGKTNSEFKDVRENKPRMVL